MYEHGRGVAQNDAVAHMWWNLAWAQGDANAKSNLDILIPKMTKFQIAEAQKMAREWQEKHQGNRKPGFPLRRDRSDMADE